MHLTALRVRGFKSFPDALDLRFFPGVAVIVGPNGSGKSNVADAIQWAMASQPPSQLRAGTGREILFAGSERRAPSAVCEVELILANADGTIDLPHDEVSIMRRLRRDGEGEYLLNRVAVRRLDVQEALADAGLGRELHCVISQGSVDEILLSRPAERRGLVEEAAGLGKFKRRRLRAEQKLARVRLDLDRAGDVEREIRSRLGPLRLQATAAERAEKLGREIAEGRLRLLGSEAAAARARRTTLTAQLNAARAERAGLEEVLEAARGRRGEAERELGSLAAAQERAAARYWGLASAGERLDGRRDALRSRLAEAARDAARARDRAAALGRDAEGLRVEADAAALAAEAAAAEAAALGPDDDAALAAASARAQEALDSALVARRASAEAEGGAARARADHDRLARRAAELEAGAAQARDARRRQAAELEAAEAAWHAAEPAAAAARTAVEAAARAADAARGAADDARAAATDRRAAAAVADEHLAGAGARLEALSAALERADGVAPAHRRLAERGATLSLGLVRPEAGLEAAVAAALARRAGMAVAADLDEALRLVAGEGLEGATVVVPEGGPVPAVPPRATPLAAHVTLALGAPTHLLDGVWLVDDATAFAGVRTGLAVTREGLGWDADLHVLFRSHAAGEAALLEARRERDVVAAERARLEDETAQLREAALAQEAAVDAAEAEERAATTGLEAAQRTLRDTESAERAARAAHERARAEAERGEAAAAAVAAEQATAREAAAQAADEAAAFERAHRDAAGRVAAAERTHAELEETRRAEAERVAARRAQAAALGERAARARDDARRASEAADQVEAAQRRAAATVIRLDAVTAVAPALEAVLAACTGLAEQARGPAKVALESFEHRATELGHALAAGREAETEAERTLRAVGERATALEVEGAHVEERLADARRRAREIAERHGLAVVEGVEPLPADEEAVLAARLERLERRRAELGAVNPLARQEYEEQAGRAEDVAEQIADLEATIRELEAVIRELSTAIRERFDATFALVRAGFGEVVGTLFPGGRGRLSLVEDDAAEGEDGERAEPGIELEVQPAGKRIAALSLLSGGEKALAALAFLFALFLARPSPFYVLDEVDAPLDDANIERFLALLERYRDRAQFIVVTHQKRTMEIADTLYGVTMAGDGVSKVLSRRVPESARRAFEPVA